MNQESGTIETLGEVLESVLGCAIDAQPQLSANDFDEWDSMENLRIIVAIEKRFGVRFSAAESASFQTLGDIADQIERKLARSSRSSLG